ncbi:MAG TPA: phosphatidate cytidylyltransferase [Alphaproteobacteria bacterium]
MNSNVANGDTARPVRSDGWTAGLRTRVISGAIMAVVALAAVVAAPGVFALLIGVGVAVLAWEWICLTNARFGVTGFVLAALVIAVVALAFLRWPGPAVLVAVVGSGIVLATARLDGRERPFWAAVGALYIGIPAAALVWLRGADAGGQHLMVWLLLTVWATDIGAFFAGRLIGGPRLAPRISPKKTWAGLVGAVVSTGLLGWVVGAADPGAPAAGALVAAGAVLAVIAQAGDLGESWVKRHFNVKDSSQLIPGHGGVFDRVDGLLAAAVALAAWQWLTGGGLAWR